MNETENNPLEETGEPGLPEPTPEEAASQEHSHQVESEIPPAEDDWKVKYEQANDLYLRTLADTENFKKRMQRDRADEKNFAAQEAVQAVLPVIDSLDRAVEAARKQLEGKDADPVIEQMFTGVEMTRKQFATALQKLNVERIEVEIGKPFDPNLHQALFQETNDEMEEGSVLEILQAGFVMAGRVIRPAMVKVSTRS